MELKPDNRTCAAGEGGRAVKRGFTLIELLVALVIVGILVGTAVVSVGAGLKSAQVADATRAAESYARHARAVALLKQRPVVLTFEEIAEGGRFVKSRISLAYGADAEAEGAGASGGAGFGAGGGNDGRVRTLSGVLVDETDDGSEPEGPDPLQAEPREFEGIHVRGEEKERVENNRPRISVFSNVDVLNRKRAAEQARAKERAAAAGVEGDGADEGEDDNGQEADKETTFSVVYEPNGRCDPYVVRIWKEGSDEDRATRLEVGRFGRPVEDDDR